MKFKKISTRMLIFVVPVLIISMLALTVISIFNSRSAIEDQLNSRMHAELSSAKNSIEEKIKGITTMANTITNMVAADYKNTSAEEYESILASIIQIDDMVLGSGLWFEPNAYKSDMEYFGPYIYKDGGSIVTTYEYSNAEYDYFNQEYYANAKNSKKLMITNPYYDPVSGIIMSTCSAPIMVDGNYTGCVTVDIELSSITDMIADIKVGESGSAVMLDSVGTFLAGVSDDRISDAVVITSDQDQDLAKAGNDILAADAGETEYTSDSGKENVYFTTIPSTGWKFYIHILQSEIMGPIVKLMTLLIIVSVIALVLEIVIMILIISDISRRTIIVKNFALELAEGNFTVSPLKSKSSDELGSMSDSLNDMYGNNKEIISGIATYADSLDTSAGKLGEASSKLEQSFNEIRSMTGKVTDEMSTTSSATEELNASSEEVLSSVTVLTSETENSMNMSNEIQKRASDIADKSHQSFETARNLTERYEKQLEKCIEGAKVVDNVSSLADVISSIAEQINLLSLNASIESARAGEAGRGFAVVANEIGTLAGNTSQTIGAIQETITDVQKAFNDLTDAAGELLNFLQDTVTPDYQNFVEVANQYGKDAMSFKESSDNITVMADKIKMVIGEVTLAIRDIADATTETTEITNQIMNSVELVSDHVTDVARMAGEQQDISDSLTDTVSKFRL